MKFNVAKASAIGGQEIPDVDIEIGPGEPPDARADYERQYRDFYGSEAQKLMEALQSLPGGTWDRLLCMMLEKKASLFRVPLFDAPLPPDQCTCVNCQRDYRPGLVPVSPSCGYCGCTRKATAKIAGGVDHCENCGKYWGWKPPAAMEACRRIAEEYKSGYDVSIGAIEDCIQAADAVALDYVTHTPDFPLVIQSVLKAAEEGKSLVLYDTEAAALASEIRKLLGRKE